MQGDVREARARLFAVAKSVSEMHGSLETLVKRLSKADIGYGMSAGMLGRLLIKKRIAA